MADRTFVDRFAKTVEESTARMLALSDAEVTMPRAPGKWSRKEIVGHLIDSAVHNHWRFVRGQLQDDLVFPGYDQDAWVRAQRYREQPWHELVDAWCAYNRRIGAIMRIAPDADLERPRARHNFDEIEFEPLPAGVPATLEFMMRDYIAHLEHHLRQIFT
jgi:hypothetical protein